MFNTKLVVTLCEDFAIIKTLKDCGAYSIETAQFEAIACLKGAADRYSRGELGAMGFSIVQNVALNSMDEDKGFRFDELPTMAREWFNPDYMRKDFLPEWREAMERIEDDTKMLIRQCL